ncbi:MAG: polysaccharide deacetylase family protein [Actinobacteria bacterium]|nr:polysaccharide deacetylase family protein [Actinomycetota bacterium]
MALRIVVTTRQRVRHRLLLALLEASLGRPPDGVLVQTFADRRPKAGVSARIRTAASRLVAPTSLDVERRLARHRARPHESVDALLEAALTVPPVDLDELARRTRVRLDPDPNSSGTGAWLEELRPDLVLVFGGKILREPWLSLPQLGALNMHYGLLPWYGGGASAEFALYHDRTDRVGVTIHEIAAGVDDGPIVQRIHVDTRGARRLEECQAEVYLVGIESLVEQAVRRDRGESPALTSQSGTQVYRRGPHTLLVEAVADLRLRHGQTLFPVQRSLDRMPRGRGLRGRLAPERIPPGVYVLLYHSIVDAAVAEPWEMSFAQIATPIERFREHVAYLASHLTPTTLPEAFELLREGPADKAYFAITFDDGYTNLVTQALPVCAEHSVRPTVFASAAFAAQEAAHYRLLLAELIRRGLAEQTAEMLGIDPRKLWAESKDAYRAGSTEAAVERAWSALVDEPWPRAHLTFEELGELVRDGWSVGNHTLRHVPLVDLDDEELERQLLENERRLVEHGLDPIPWISYPFGRTSHVDATLDAFLDRNPDSFGIFAAGGVNVIPSRKEWLRLSVEGNVTASGVRDTLFREARATLAALDALAG